jgi:hypothetical protein
MGKSSETVMLCREQKGGDGGPGGFRHPQRHDVEKELPLGFGVAL